VVVDAVVISLCHEGRSQTRRTSEWGRGCKIVGRRKVHREERRDERRLVSALAGLGFFISHRQDFAPTSVPLVAFFIFSQSSHNTTRSNFTNGQEGTAAARP
jgi:hypothetical protein